ncbi:hypothetical protein L21TH_0385 [Caldisalinibacter kiritimatiensis]|uniref:Uncharacterized protein n=1 Tax=Caldisalinibacter kiritimatiensis TaxID=1304284 RepID=R1CGW0_9FIRM|nr:hypothetical protein L21TH_0385 [Caldisalinibacter kiritimatiensis]
MYLYKMLNIISMLYIKGKGERGKGTKGGFYAVFKHNPNVPSTIYNYTLTNDKIQL